MSIANAHTRKPRLWAASTGVFPSSATQYHTTLLSRQHPSQRDSLVPVMASSPRFEIAPSTAYDHVGESQAAVELESASHTLQNSIEATNAIGRRTCDLELAETRSPSSQPKISVQPVTMECAFTASLQQRMWDALFRTSQDSIEVLFDSGSEIDDVLHLHTETLHLFCGASIFQRTCRAIDRQCRKFVVDGCTMKEFQRCFQQAIFRTAESLAPDVAIKLFHIAELLGLKVITNSPIDFSSKEANVTVRPCTCEINDAPVNATPIPKLQRRYSSEDLAPISLDLSPIHHDSKSQLPPSQQSNRVFDGFVTASSLFTFSKNSPEPNGQYDSRHAEAPRSQLRNLRVIRRSQPSQPDTCTVHMHCDTS